MAPSSQRTPRATRQSSTLIASTAPTSLLTRYARVTKSITLPNAKKSTSHSTRNQKLLEIEKLSDLECDTIIVGKPAVKSALKNPVEKLNLGPAKIEIPVKALAIGAGASSHKRKRCAEGYESSDDSDAGDSSFESTCGERVNRGVPSVRKVKKARFQSHLQLQTPPSSVFGSTSEDDDVDISHDSVESVSSRPQPSSLSTVSSNLKSQDTIPQQLQDLIALHQVFLKALTIHFAHNGPSTPAEIISLTTTMTRLWKIRKVQREDLQRVLAIYELSASPDSDDYTTTAAQKEISHQHSPFNLITSGVGLNQRTCVEHLPGQTPFREESLHDQYQTNISQVLQHLKTQPSSSTNPPSIPIPLLKPSTGTQTSMQAAKTSSLRHQLLHRPQPEPSPIQTIEFSSLSITDPSSTDLPQQQQQQQQQQQPPKSRTSKLFERVKQKQCTGSIRQDPSSLLRRRAVARIDEITEILRMKQSQTSTGKAAALTTSFTATKSAYGWNHLVQQVKQSVRVPIDEEEIKICLILLERVSGGWLRVGDYQGVKGVSLCGRGISGVEVKRILSMEDNAGQEP